MGSLAGSGFQELGGNFAKSAAGTIGFSAVAGGVGAELTGANVIFTTTKHTVAAPLANMAAGQAGKNAFRYMSQAELKAIQKTGLLRGGNAGETYFTKDLYKSAAKASQRLGLESTPSLRVEFEILNNPTLLRNGSKVLSLKGLSGGGAEFMTLDPVKVRLINWQFLK